MANNSPTIVAASLSDDQLKKSIDSLVTHVDEAMKKMVQSTNNAVGEMEAKLKSLGNLKIDSGSSNDGGTGRRTQQHEKLTKAVNDASEAVSKETQKLQDLQQSLSGVSDREQNFISQKERAANTIAQENELLQRQENELNNLKSQQQSFVSSEQAKTAALNAQKQAFDVLDAKTKEYLSTQERLLQKGSGITPNERKLIGIDQQTLALIERAKRELDSFNLTLSDGTKYSKDPFSSKFQSLEILKKELDNNIRSFEQWKKETHLTTDDITKIDAVLQKYKEYSRIIDELRNKESKLLKNHDVLKFTDDFSKYFTQRIPLVKADESYQDAYWKLQKTLSQAIQTEQQKSQIDAQVAAKEKEIAETKGRIAAATKEQSEADKNASQAAKEKANIQSQVESQEKKVADAKRQLATATQQQTEVEKQSVQNIAQQTAARDKQIKKNQEAATSFDQIAAAQQKAAQSQGDSTLKKSFNRQELQQYIDRLRELQAEYIKVNTQQGAGAKSDKIKADMRNLEELIAKYKEILRNLDYVNSRQGTIDVKKWVQDLGAVDDRYKKLTRWYTVLEKEDQRRIVSEEKANQRRLADLEKEKAAQDKVIKSYQDSVLKAEFGKVMKMPTTNIDEIRAKFERLSTIIANIRELGILSPEKISAADSEVKKLGASIQRYEKFEQERIAAEQKFIAEQAKEIEQTQTLEGRVKALAQAAREYLQANNENRWSTSAYGKGLTIYAENDARAKGLSIEEQIARQLQAEEVLIAQQVSAAQQLNSERKKYVAPTAYDIRDTANNVIANKLGIKSNQVVNANIYSDSIRRVSAEYKQLQDTIAKMSTYERNSPIGRYMIQRMQELERQTQRTRAELSRPISFQAAKGLSEATLDDMAYKLRQLQSYKMGLNVKTQINEMKEVDKEIVNLKKRYDELMGKNQQMIASNTALGRSWNYMKNRLAFYFTVGASTQFVKNLIEVRSQYEMNERALGILINSAERGTQIFNELSQMALVSPYTLIELSSAAKQLTAYDIAAKDVVNTTRRLADMAAAVGIPIERLTYALGQIKAYGYLNSRDARMFANAGIPLVKQLSDYYTELEGRLVSTADVYDRIKKKAIDYNEVMEVINKMTDEGGKFFDFQAKMADTLKVRLANLTLAWNNMLNDMGKESQGVLTWGIGALREMFLHWKQLDSLIKNAAWALGIRTALMFIAYSALKVGVALGVTNKQMALSSVFGTRLAGVLKTVALSMKAIVTSPLTWWSLLAIAAVEATQALFGVNEAQKALNESIRNGAKDNYDNISKFLEQYKEVRDSLYKTVTKPVPNGMLNVQEWTDSQGNKWHNVSREYTETLPQDIDKNEAKKAWEAVREQIELTVASSDKYIGNLLSISNMSERVRQGFNLLDDVQVVNAALKELDDDTIKVSKDMSAWWNAWQAPDGLIGNLKDLVDAENELIETYGSVEAAKKGGGKLYTDYEKRELANFRDDLRETTNSIINFIELKGWSGNEGKINQVFEQITQKLVLDNQLDPQKAFTLQTEVEEARSKVAKQALLQRINDERAALKIAHDDSVREALAADVERYKNWDETNGRSKVEWERFTKWLKEQHISETTAMFRNMDAEDIKSLNFQEGKHAEWVTRMVTQYAKEHKMSIDDVEGYLKNFVRNANRMSIFIPLIISTEDKKSVYDQLGEYDKAVDEADAQIERLTKRINELNAKKKKSKEETQELANAEQELADAQKAKADAEAKGGHGKKEKKDEKAANKAAKQAETELAKALKEELSTIDKVRSIYKDLTKEGMSHANAVERATRGWDKTVNAINRVLQKNGLQKLDLSKFAGIENPRELVNMLQSQLNTLLKRGAKPAEIKELQTKVNTLEVDAEKYDLTKITKGLNNELGKLKDEYELAVAIDADPELGNAFADMMGINVESLPHTVKEYADEYSKYLNKYLKGKNSEMQLTGDELRGLTRDDINALQSQVDAGTFNQEWFDAIKKAYEDISGKRKKDLEDTEKWKNSLIEKYGNLQDKLTKIYKDSVQNQVNAVKTFGTEDQKSDIVRLQLRLEATDNPAELTEINTEIAKIVKDVTDKNPIALKVVTSSNNQTKADTSKAYWEDFKNNDELYAMTFEDMANNSTRAIELIIDNLNSLKDHVKEDPASMKALVKSLEDAEKELNARDPFGGIARSLKNMEEASKETKDAQEALWRAEVDVEQAQQAYDNAEDGTPEEREAAQKALASAIQKRTDAQNNLTKAENKGKKAQENLKSSLQGVTGQLGNVKSLFDTVSSLFRAGGDDETADAIDAISEGFSIMTTVIMGVVAAMTLIKASHPELLAIAAALSVIVGLAKFLSGNDNEKIDKEVKESELAVKRLENQYKKLQAAVEDAYGTMAYAAEKAAVANKKLQLEEMKRQLRLEQSRDSKDRDDDKIESLRGQIIDLEREIQKATDNWINDMLGISSVGDAAEQLVSSMIDAFRQGEDYMGKFYDSFDEMIENMIMKAIATKVIGEYIESMWNDIKSKAEARSKKEAQDVEETQSKYNEAQNSYDAWVGAEGVRALTGDKLYEEELQRRKDMLKKAEEEKEKALKEYEKAITPTPSDVEGMREDAKAKSDFIKEWFDATMKEWGIAFGDKSNKNLSNLQQGIQGITEDTAGALESYMNGVSQQVYLHSDLLTQIRDAVVGMDMDVQVATQAQMLLQLQQSYAVQMAIQGILEGTLNPSGQGFRVELIN